MPVEPILFQVGEQVKLTLTSYGPGPFTILAIKPVDPKSSLARSSQIVTLDINGKPHDFSGDWLEPAGTAGIPFERTRPRGHFRITSTKRRRPQERPIPPQ